MDFHQKILTDIEIHSPGGIKECFENGVNPNDRYNDKPLVYELTSQYLRSPGFSECIKVFVDYGLDFDDQVLLAVLLNDADALERQIKHQPVSIFSLYTLKSAFTPLNKASLLHICAEYNHLDCARILVKQGLNVNGKAGLDKKGFGGQTPVFHTVNQHNNNSLDMLKFLISEDADPHLTVMGLIWGKGYAWETFIPAVNPISYAIMGLLRQFQRKESDIYENVKILMNAGYGVDFLPANIPNKYLTK